MPGDDVTMCEPEPPISEAPLPTPEDWVRLYWLAERASLARYSSVGGVWEDAFKALDGELWAMHPTYLRMKE